MDGLRTHYAEEHWSNADKSYRSDKQVEQWHDEEHNEDVWFFRPDHEHAQVSVKPDRRRK